MSTRLYSHRACLEHDTGFGHPESPDRLRAVLAELTAPAFDALDRCDAPKAEPAQLYRVHDVRYVRAVLDAASGADRIEFAPSTVISRGTGEALLRAAGAVCAAVDAVVSGEATNAFCAVRPPGHHAGPRSAMGYCLLNNVAVGAAHARVAHGLDRIAIVDFDVHCGNGTEAIVRNAHGILFASIHQSFLFPDGGRRNGEGRRDILNVGLPRHSGGEAFRRAFETRVLPTLADYRPGMILVSAGFDGQIADTAADLRLTDADFAWASRALVRLAQPRCGGRLVSVLEAGYHLRSLARASALHMHALLNA